MCLGVHQYRKMFYHFVFFKNLYYLWKTHIIFFYLVDKPLRSGYLLPLPPPLETIFLSLENSLKWIENEFSSLNLDWRINFFKSFFQNIFQMFDFV
jgi:hypothetical protein